ncbi:MAG: TraR/DksA C4-type zinc finger protein [Chitinophagaceae bacterium]|nr:TraR/DksA C4-type zinc finger protein [Chitinophagaceae bacterium]
MATKQPLKLIKPASKPTVQAKKATPVKKSVPLKKAAPAKAAAKGKPVAPAKKVVPEKKAAVAPAKTTEKSAGKVITVVKPPAAKTTNTTKAPQKLVSKKIAAEVKKSNNSEKAKATIKQAAKTEAPAAVPLRAANAKTLGTQKSIIVPPKPAVNPKPEKIVEKKVDNKPSKPVVIPKTSTDKKVTYEPDFTKSVLDTPEPVISTGPIMRYSDTDLTEFRDLINKKLDAAKKELGYLQGLITRKDEMGGDESDNRYMTMEDGSMSMEREQLSQMASRQITFIDHLEKAIMRIENKTYGICRVTGKLIDKARLRAVPHATLSMEAKLGIAK